VPVIAVGLMKGWWLPSRSADGIVDLRASSCSLATVIADRTIVAIRIIGAEEH